jgi:hypothetical protein
MEDGGWRIEDRESIVSIVHSLSSIVNSLYPRSSILQPRSLSRFTSWWRSTCPSDRR